jgi:hypothetical protein
MAGKENIQFLKSLNWLKYTGPFPNKRKDVLVCMNIQMRNPIIESRHIKFLVEL